MGLYTGEYSTKKLVRKVIVDGEEVKADSEAEEYYQDGIRPAIFKTLLGKGHQDFSTGQQ